LIALFVAHLLFLIEESYLFIPVNKIFPMSLKATRLIIEGPVLVILNEKAEIICFH